MANRNGELIRRALDRFNKTGAPDPELYDPELIFVARPDGPVQPTYTGFDGLMRMNALIREAWDSIHLEIVDEVEPSEGVVVIVLHARLRSHSGVELEATEAWVNWIRAGKVWRIEQYGTKDEALRAAG